MEIRAGAGGGCSGICGGRWDFITWGTGSGDTSLLHSQQGHHEIKKNEKEPVLGRSGEQNVPEEGTSRAKVVRRGEMVR